jgi:primosomal protein N' (replication factor Y)
LLDRPFTYVLPDDADAGLGSLVSVPFHGRVVKAWIVGPAAELPAGRLSTVKKVLSPVRFFDERMLRLLRWVSERYIAPLATVIARSHPPRVVSEEKSEVEEAVFGAGFPPAPRRRRLAGPPRASAPPDQRTVQFEPGSVTWVRPLPGKEAEECLDAVRATIEAGERAIVLVPEAEPVPFTAQAVLQEFGDRAVSFLGGDARERYRTWLAIQSGQHHVVVGTRPAVFAPLTDLGLVWVSREVHPGHREDRSPYYRVRDVAAARAELERAACVLASLSPSVETAAGIQSGAVVVRRRSRDAERAAAPLVETVPPEAEDRSPRLAALLKKVGSAALIVSRSGYGVARVCRSCGQAAACAQCRGSIVSERGTTACRACGASGRCANCGGTTFGIERAGTERILEWVRSVGNVPAVLADEADGGTAAPVPGRVLVGTAAAVNDVIPPGLDLVAILDPDRALVRPGIRAGERALATWMEAAAWARSRSRGGRVLAQTRRPGHPAIQALVRWDPTPFLLREAEERRIAGFAPNHPVFRLEGTSGLEAALTPASPETLLASPRGDGTVCLVAVRPDDVPAFRTHVLRLAAEGTVTRVEAEPQI